MFILDNDFKTEVAALDVAESFWNGLSNRGEGAIVSSIVPFQQEFIWWVARIFFGPKAGADDSLPIVCSIIDFFAVVVIVVAVEIDWVDTEAAFDLLWLCLM